MDKLLAAQPLKVPVMLVHSLWDQEDIYGAPAVYKAIEPKDTDNDKVFLVIGPWHHGQMIGDGSSLGALQIRQRHRALLPPERSSRPFLDQYLKDDAPKADIAPVTAFETGTNVWRRLPAWPPGCRQDGCTIRPTPLYLRAGLKLSFDAPAAGDAAFEEYISDPAKPVPFRAPAHSADGLRAGQHLAAMARRRPARGLGTSRCRALHLRHADCAGEDQRRARSPTWSPRRAAPTADWVVKLIDVYPDEVAGQPAMGGYQLMVSADIFRGRYRESFETPKAHHRRQAAAAIASPCPRPTMSSCRATASWCRSSRAGSRSTTAIRRRSCPNIFWAKPDDYRKATQRIYHSTDHASFVELPLVTTEK